MKTMSPEQKQKEIARWEREKAKPKGRGYMAWFLLIITVIYLADEVVSQVGGQMQSVIASQIFAPVVGDEYAVARMSAFSMISMAASGLAFLYKPLSDRYGRRIFLIINTFGMGIGAVVISLATNIPVYLLGAAIAAFFIPHDMQAVYIQECAPAKHRAKLYSVIKSVATLGVFLIPLLRRIFIPGNDLTNWRYVYLVPGIMTIAAAIFAFFCVRESDAFLETRLRQLRMTEEEIAAAKANKQNVQARGGLIQALVHSMRNKQIRWIMIANGFIMFGMVVTSYYEAIMTNGYAQQFLAQGMDLVAARAEANTYVTRALMLFSVGSALFQLFPGFLADALGRKKTAVIMTGCLLVSFLVFYFGSNHALNPYVVGFFAGAMVGAYWYTGDLMGLMLSESTPTNLRASVMSVQPFVSGMIYSLSMVLTMVLPNVLGDNAIGMVTLCTFVHGMTIGLILMAWKVRETKGVDMGKVGMEE